MKSLLFSFLAVLAVATAPIAALADVQPNVLDLTTVILTADAPNGQFAIGSGVIIGDSGNGQVTILTAAHVVDHPHLAVHFNSGEVEAATATKFVKNKGAGEKTDLAIVVVPQAKQPYPVTQLATQPLPVGSTVTIVGAPNAAFWTHSNGKIIAYAGSQPIFLCDTCADGDSGGGMFNQDGQLVGIVFGNTTITVTVHHADGTNVNEPMDVWLPDSLPVISALLK